MLQVAALARIRKSPLLDMKSTFERSPLLIKRIKPENAIIIPAILIKVNFSAKNKYPMKAINTGEVPIIHPVFEAVVY
jgi:hypothetical protein